MNFEYFVIVVMHVAYEFTCTWLSNCSKGGQWWQNCFVKNSAIFRWELTTALSPDSGNTSYRYWHKAASVIHWDISIGSVWLSVRQSPAVWRYWWIPVIDILRWTEWDVEWTSCQTHTWTHGARGLIIIPVWPGTVTVGPLSTLPTCGASSISPDIRASETCPFPRKLP